MTSQILTYPHGLKYRDSDWARQVKQGTNGSIPCNNELREGSGNYNDSQSGEWKSSGVGNLTFSFYSNQPQNNPFNQEWGGTDQRGVHYWIETGKNDTRSHWFDIGAEGTKTSGYNMSGGARSSWLREVTALWFLFHGHTTYESQGCYAYVKKVGLRYRDPNNKIQIYECTDKLGDLELGELHRGDSKRMFGYALPQSRRQTICRNNYRFLGIRIQINLQKTKGTLTRTICGGCTGIRLGLGETPIGSYNETAKRALVGRGNMTWNEFEISDKMMLETR